MGENEVSDSEFGVTNVCSGDGFSTPPWSSRFVFKFKFVFPEILDIREKVFKKVRGRKEKMEEKVGRLPVKLNDCTVKLTFYAPLYQKPCLMKNSRQNVTHGEEVKLIENFPRELCQGKKSSKAAISSLCF